MGRNSDLLEKMRIRRELMAKIQKLQREISIIRELMQEFQGEGRTISMALDSWEGQHGMYQSSDLAPDISVAGSYEGTTANSFSGELPQAAGELEAVCGQMQAVAGGIQDQITRLEKYIEKLTIKMRELQAQLAAL